MTTSQLPLIGAALALIGSVWLDFTVGHRNGSCDSCRSNTAQHTDPSGGPGGLCDSCRRER